MKTKLLTSVWLLLFFLCGPLVHSAMPAATETGTGKRPVMLRFGIHVSEMGNLDPHFAAGSQDRALADMVFNGLLRYQPGNAPKIEPDLAEQIPGFEMIGGRQVWTVKLRKGILFHPGPQTAAYALTTMAAHPIMYTKQW
ncbi:MAG: hypothetical protein KFF68_05680 [Desulfosarcina sp.]|nr:hypothetical protein [Desulfosarcina sp.]